MRINSFRLKYFIGTTGKKPLTKEHFKAYRSHYLKKVIHRLLSQKGNSSIIEAVLSITEMFDKLNVCFKVRDLPQKCNSVIDRNLR